MIDKLYQGHKQASWAMGSQLGGKKESVSN